nr:hypothetical protein B0A51_03881 [Rachicladosporium sp. CCFEE 5018]
MDRSLQAKDHTPSELIIDEPIIETPQAADLDPQISSLSLPLSAMQMTSGSRDEECSTPPSAATPRDTDGAPKVFVSAEELTDLFNDTEKSLCYDGSFKLVDSPVSARPELLLDSVLKERHIHGYRVRSARDNAADGDDNEKHEVVYKPIPWGLPGNDRWEDSYLCDGSRAFADKEYYSIDRWRRFHPPKKDESDRKNDGPSRAYDLDKSDIDLSDSISSPGQNHQSDQDQCIETWECSLSKRQGVQRSKTPADTKRNHSSGEVMWRNMKTTDNQGFTEYKSWPVLVRKTYTDRNNAKRFCDITTEVGGEQEKGEQGVPEKEISPKPLYAEASRKS